MLRNDGGDDVYPASEDTHLLIDALMSESSQFVARGASACLCLELGIGNGLVTDSMLERYGCNVLGVDVNLSALQHVSWSKRSQPASADLLRSDLVSWARSTRGGMFDIVVFNPPYVPTDADELARARVSHDISASWAGGHRGREIIDDALRSVRRVLVHGGLFYLVVENRNDVQDVLRLARTCGFQDGDIVLKRRAGPETLYVLRFRNG